MGSCESAWPGAPAAPHCSTKRQPSPPLGLRPWVAPASTDELRAFTWAQIDTLSTLLEEQGPHAPMSAFERYLLARHYVALELGSENGARANAAAARALRHLGMILHEPRYSGFSARDEVFLRALEISWRTADLELTCAVIRRARSVDLRPPLLQRVVDIYEQADCASRWRAHEFVEGEDEGDYGDEDDTADEGDFDFDFDFDWW